MMLRRKTLTIVFLIIGSLLSILFLTNCGGGGGGSVTGPPPDISGGWAGTWSGSDPVAGLVTGNWQADVLQVGTTVSGSGTLSGDVDCSDGTLAGNVGANNVPSGTLSRPPCQQNSWVITALDLNSRTVSGTWTQPGSGASGTFTGTQVAKPGGPQISFFTPQGGMPGAILTVAGSGFEPIISNNLLLFNNVVKADIISATPTRIVAKVPQGAPSGTLFLGTTKGIAISPRSFDVTASFPIPVNTGSVAVGSLPEGVVTSPDGRRVFAANRGSGTVSMININTRGVLSTTRVFDPGGSLTGGIAISPDGRRLYADYYDTISGEKGVAVLHGTTSALLRNIPLAAAQPVPVPVNPGGVAVSPDNTFVVVANSVDGGSFYGIDAGSGQIVASVAVGAGSVPTGAAMSPDARTAYLLFSGANVVKVLDIDSRSVTATIVLSMMPTSIAVSPDGQLAYVTSAALNTVKVIDTATNLAVTTWSGFAAPAGVAVSPDGSRVYVANSAGDSISVVRAADGAVDATVLTAAAPVGIALTPDGKLAYVTSSGAGTVNEIGGVASLTIAKGGIGIGTVTTQPGGISCGVNCSAQFPLGTVVTLIAIPGANSIFAGWDGDPDCIDGVVTMRDNKTCVAIFNSTLACFIATAAYGSSLDPHVAVLRTFRNRYLMTNDVGRTLVGAYYRHSPPLAAFISRHETVREAVRLMLTPLVYGIEHWTDLAPDGKGDGR